MSAVFLMNAWYVVAWSREVGRELLPRTLCGTDVLLYRTEDGRPVALEDRCAHRAYPLSQGRLVGDDVQCGYHGFRFGCDGVCVRVPGQDRIPKNAVVRGLPVHEQDGWVWVWPGDTERADPAAVPDTHWMNDPAWAAVRHTRQFDCSAGLLHDNLLDLTHEAFIHEDSIGDAAVYENGVTVTVEDTVVSVDRFMPDCHPSPLFEKAAGIAPPVDRWHTTIFHTPSLHVIDAGVVAPGRPRAEGHLIRVLNAITPITETTSWYFYAFCRDFAVGERWADELLSTSLGKVLDEDAEALRHQEHGMRQRPGGVHDVLIAQDAGVAKARRLMARRLADEEATEAGRGGAAPR